MQLLTVKDVIEILKISEGTLYRLVKDGKIRAHKLRNRTMFLLDEIKEDIKKL